MTEQFYVGIDQDHNEGLTHLGRIVRDAWVFGILPETETCVGWSGAQMQSLYEKSMPPGSPMRIYPAVYRMNYAPGMTGYTHKLSRAPKKRVGIPN